MSSPSPSSDPPLPPPVNTPPSISPTLPPRAISPLTPAHVAPNTSQPRRAIPRLSISPRDRINSILEGARHRAAAATVTTAMDSSDDGELPSGLRIGAKRSEEAESSADEETSMVRRSAQGVNYQSTSTRNGNRESAGRRRTGDVTPGGDVEDEEMVGSENESWWARMLSKYGSIELENKGSVARDHLAIERTFLAWLRTSLAFASIGIAITQLFRLNTTSSQAGGGDPYKHLRQMGKPLGATFLGVSIVMLGVGFHRYFETQNWIIRGKFPASRGSIAFVAAVTCALMVTSLVVVIVVEPGAFEK